MIRLVSSTFTWTTSEQVYPFQLAEDGGPLFCKKIDVGVAPNNGVKDTAHNIGVGFTGDKVVDYWGTMSENFGPNYTTMLLAHGHPLNLAYQTFFAIGSSVVHIRTGTSWANHFIKVYIIYRK